MAKKHSSKSVDAPTNVNVGVEELLAQQQTLWDESEPSSFGTIPDGRYVAEIVDTVVEKGGSENERLQARYTLQIVSAQQNGRICWRTMGLESEVGLSMLKGDLETLGVSIPGNISELPSVLYEHVKGLVVNIRLKTKVRADGSFQNVNIMGIAAEQDMLGLSSAGAEPETPTSEPAAAKEKTPNLTNQRVTFIDDEDGSTVIGTVKTDDDGAEVTVEDANGADWAVGREELTIIDEFTEEHTENIGKQASFTDEEGKKQTGTVVSFDAGRYAIRVGNEEWDVDVAEVTLVKKKAPAKRKPAKKKKA